MRSFVARDAPQDDAVMILCLAAKLDDSSGDAATKIKDKSSTLPETGMTGHPPDCPPHSFPATRLAC
jgi:hypothetical protein